MKTSAFWIGAALSGCSPTNTPAMEAEVVVSPVDSGETDTETPAADSGGEDAGVADSGEAAWAARAEPCGLPGGFGECAVPGWDGRPYVAYQPTDVAVSAPTAVVLMFHGGSGNAESGMRSTCPGANLDDPACLHQVAEREGFAVIYVNGTPREAGSTNRMFNAGGGANGWQCLSGPPCQDNVDDVAYTRAVLDSVEGWLNVDPGAVFATGLSNGGAMIHRLACELSDRIAAIAPVGAGNQFSTTAVCTPEQPVAVLHVHGDGDLCWTYEESTASCLGVTVQRKIGAMESSTGWAVRNRCVASPTVTPEDDLDGDGLRTVVMSWASCAAPVQLLRLAGAGHTYPNGFQYFAPDLIGPTLRDWGSERLWSFFDENRRE